MLNTAVLIAGLAIAQLTAEKPPQAQPPAPKPAPTAPATPAPAAPSAPAAKPPAATPATTAPRQSVPSRTTMTITVTDRQGRPLPNVTVRATGPTEREGTTDPEGNVTLRNAAPGTYRLRFDHESHVPFEKEITVAGRPARTTAELTAAPPPPPPPPPPKPEPAPAPATSASSQVPPSGPPSSVAIPDFYEKNQIGRAPFKSSPVGCTATATAALLQLRDPLAEHSHNDADEMLYVVAGSGVQRIGGIEVNLAAGTFIVIPRGTPHSVTRRGGNPLLLVSILTGPPCDPAKNK